VSGLVQYAHVLADGELLRMASSPPVVPDVPQEPSFDFVSGKFLRKGVYEIRWADGHTRQFKVSGIPKPVSIEGSWEVQFQPGWGAPEKVVFDNLISWCQSEIEGVRCFSGSATYYKTFNYQPVRKSGPDLKQSVILDLGRVEVMARLKLNGKDLGLLWKPPYQADITEAVKSGENTLEIRVVNLSINRMIGDEQLPEDSKRNENGTLKEWPPWLLEGKPSPTGRFTFTSWRMWKKDSPLQESGLLGPVTIATQYSTK
jgi:hypothetical protein